MALYFSCHTTACMTKQALRNLMLKLLADSELKVHRCVSSQTGGRMLTEVEAPDQTSLARWFEARSINVEWSMRIDLEARKSTVTEY